MQVGTSQRDSFTADQSSSEFEGASQGGTGRAPGRVTLTSKLPPQRNAPTSTTPTSNRRSEQRTSTEEVDPFGLHLEPTTSAENLAKPDEYVPLTFPVPAATQESVKRLNAKYAKRTQRKQERSRLAADPGLAPLLAEHLVDVVRFAIPASEANAKREIAKEGIYFKGSAVDVFEGLVAQTRWTFLIRQGLLDDMRDRNPKPGEPISAAGTVNSSESWTFADAFAWVGKALTGDFNEDPTIGQTILDTLVSLIPVVDQVMDARDIIANLYLLIWKEQYDDPMTWLNFALTLIGAIPEVGTAIKGIGKLILKGAKQFPLAKVIKALGGTLDGAVKVIGKFVDGFDGMSRRMIDRCVRYFGKVQELLGTLKDSLLTTLSATARRFMDRLYAAARAVTERVADALDAAFAKIRQAFDEIMERLRSKMSKDVPKTETPTTDVPKTDAPKTETPKTETPKTETPKTETPKTETGTTTAELDNGGGKVEISTENLNKGSGGETDIYAATMEGKQVVVRVPRGDHDGGLAMYQLEKARDLEPLGGPKVYDLVAFERDGKKCWGVVTDRIGTKVNGNFIGGYDLFRFFAGGDGPFAITGQHLRALEAFRDRVKAAKVELGDVQPGDFVFTADGGVVPVDLIVVRDSGKVGSAALDTLIDRLRDKLGL